MMKTMTNPLVPLGIIAARINSLLAQTSSFRMGRTHYTLRFEADSIHLKQVIVIEDRCVAARYTMDDDLNPHLPPEVTEYARQWFHQQLTSAHACFPDCTTDFKPSVKPHDQSRAVSETL